MVRELLALIAAEAHPGHASCAGGAPGVALEFPDLVPIGPGPRLGSDLVSPIAEAGAGKAPVTALHALYCHPK
ncbi:MAG: hypothetical protein FJZ92_06295 [Chloroflexi bacterium]|nr:hypothetical protein [Chloroflexota bacterium]